MSQPQVLVVLWVFYVLWLIAGWLDYRDHRAHARWPSSGAREAALHLAMLGLVAMGLGATLAFPPSHALLVVLLGLALAYLATTSANPRRVDGRGAMRHAMRLLHSVFEALPLLGLALFIADSLPRLDGLPAPHWTLALRTPPLPAGVWAAVFLPVVAFAIGPGLAELRRALRARDTQPT